MMLRCSGEQTCEVVFPNTDVDHLSNYLMNPERIMKALLSRDRLQGLPGNRFVYTSRPYRLLSFDVQPQVVFLVEWTGSSLTIVFESCQITGLDDIGKTLEFHCTACLRPDQSRIIADAEAELSLDKSGAMGLLPDAILLKLGRKVLNIVFERLQSRCQKRLKKAGLKWLQNQSSSSMKRVTNQVAKF